MRKGEENGLQIAREGESGSRKKEMGCTGSSDKSDEGFYRDRGG
jgi:hypothetical protein